MKKLLLILALASAAFAGEPRLVVHEWGTFTSISGKNGVSLEYRPLTGVSDLPSFVYTSGGPGALRQPGVAGKFGARGNVRMETPVLYFYTHKSQEVSVKVRFPKGTITEFYPKARSLEDGIDWGKIFIESPYHQSPVDRVLPGGDRKNPYFRARETDADFVRVCDEDGYQYEKFLFYRGVATFDLPVKVKLDERMVRIDGLTSPAIVFENDHGKIGYRLTRDTGTVLVERPDLKERTIEPLLEDLVKVLVAQGLFEKEARAMVATWKDSWFEDGLRVFYILPRRETDAMLPLTIEPRPAEVVRVLVGRAEVITPELEVEVLGAVTRLGNNRAEIREAAQSALEKHGRFARPILEKLLETARDAEVRDRIHQLLSR